MKATTNDQICDYGQKIWDDFPDYAEKLHDSSFTCFGVAPFVGKSNLYASAEVKRRWAKKAVCAD